MDERTCRECGATLPPPRAGRGAQPAYCDGCRPNRARTYQVSKETGSYARKLKAKRDRYVATPRQREDRRCSEDGCDAKHLARGMCRKHYYQMRRDQGIDVAVEVVVLRAVCHRWMASAPKVKSVRCTAPVGILPDCPVCKSLMSPLSPHHFICRSCWTDAEFNAEEVAWLAGSGRHSTSR